MQNLRTIEQQLKAVGCNFRFWGRPEIIELSKIIMPGETIAQCVNGQYEGGFALLCVTDQRVLLIDRKPLYLTIEDIRFEMISDVNFNHRLLESSIQIVTGIKTLQFTAYSTTRLRIIMDHIQQRITEVRRRQSDAAQVLAAQFGTNNVSETAASPVTAVPVPPLGGWRRQIALQVARSLGPCAVAHSQRDNNLSPYKLPLMRRPYRTAV